MSFIVKRHSKTLAPNVYLSDDAHVKQPWRTSLKQAKRYDTKLAAKTQAALALINGGNDTYVVQVKTKRTLARVGDIVTWGLQRAAATIVSFDQQFVNVKVGDAKPFPVDHNYYRLSFAKREGDITPVEVLGPVKGFATGGRR